MTNNGDRLVPRLYLYRGLPGSGKSTMGSKLGCCVISPSDFSSFVGGEYHWSRENYMKHKMAWRSVVSRIMEIQCNLCICELMLEKPYIAFWLEIAKRYYYEVHIKTLLIDLQTSQERNQHGVTKTSIQEIHDQMDYGIPDQVIDYSGSAWHPDYNESTFYGLKSSNYPGDDIKEYISNRDLSTAQWIHWNFSTCETVTSINAKET